MMSIKSLSPPRSSAGASARRRSTSKFPASWATLCSCTASSKTTTSTASASPTATGSAWYSPSRPRVPMVSFSTGGNQGSYRIKTWCELALVKKIWVCLIKQVSADTCLHLQQGKWLEVQLFALQCKRLEQMFTNRPKPSAPQYNQ